MANALNKKAILKQSLLDSGCSQELLEQCMELADQSKESELKLLLRTKKRELLSSVHAEQEQMDCLDFLVYQIEKGNIL